MRWACRARGAKTTAARQAWILPACSGMAAHAAARTCIVADSHLSSKFAPAQRSASQRTPQHTLRQVLGKTCGFVAMQTCLVRFRFKTFPGGLGCVRRPPLSLREASRVPSCTPPPATGAAAAASARKQRWTSVKDAAVQRKGDFGPAQHPIGCLV